MEEQYRQRYIREAVNEMKSGKAPWFDGFPVQCLKKFVMAALVRMTIMRLLNVSFDWRGACIVHLYKGKGDKYECSNSRGISLLSVVGNIMVECSFK